MLIGYARVSTQDQNLDLQRDALKTAGCEKIFEDQISAVRAADRPGLMRTLELVRAGDVLVVWKLDRLGRSVKDLIHLVGELAKRDVHFKSLTDSIDTSNNIQHPTYKALAELGRAVKTIFLCRYLNSEALRHEIHEGLNVVEQWNGANDFVFFAKRGELASNRHEDHEASMLCLHLLQNCMVYINTLMMQRILSTPEWEARMTPTDFRAITPLVWEHINPYGRYELDMESRLAI